MPVRALTDSLSHTLAISLRPRSLLSILVLLSVRFSDLFQFLFLSECSLSYFQGFLFGSSCGCSFCLSVARFGIHIFFIVVRLLSFFFWSLFRFPSLSAGSECLGGSSYSSPRRLSSLHS